MFLKSSFGIPSTFLKISLDSIHNIASQLPPSVWVGCKVVCILTAVSFIFYMGRFFGYREGLASGFHAGFNFRDILKFDSSRIPTFSDFLVETDVFIRGRYYDLIINVKTKQYYLGLITWLKTMGVKFRRG